MWSLIVMLAWFVAVVLVICPVDEVCHPRLLAHDRLGRLGLPPGDG